MHFFKSIRTPAMLLTVALLISRSIGAGAALGDYAIAENPLFLGGNEPPLMMMVMSRDEQLFNKAYSDYTDLDGDGALDITYQDSFDYAGYFDPEFCYDGGQSSSPFKATRKANLGTAENRTHICGGAGEWSGNFLNWVTMSRLDVLRYVLYGGQRSVDTEITVLERANIPSDLHAWVKVYRGSDISNFSPLTGTQSFCNTSLSSSGAPLMRVAAGNWSEWAATALQQCRLDSEVSSSQTKGDSPASATDYIVRVQVCDASKDAAEREAFCRTYGTSSKPAGLLQEYGETGRLRFGLISGTYSKPRSGGVLRRNIGKLAGNGTGAGCAPGDEIDLSTGRFCNQTDGEEGVINTLSRFKLDQWNYSSVWNDCDTWGLLNRQGFSSAGQGNMNNPGTGGQNCSAWGNPLAEMYAEALRYVAGESSATGAFAGGSEFGMPTPAWQDPYDEGGSSHCAGCSILVLSSGLASFDSDELPSVPSVSAVGATDAVGAHEGVAGNYMVGRVVADQGELNVGNSVNTHEDICTAKDVQGQLARVRGLCPDAPSMEGSYLMAGLAFEARTTDMRPGLQGRTPVTTYAVELAESLPKFDVPVGDGKLTLSPLCQANKSGAAVIGSANWRTCFLGSVGVGVKTAQVAPYHVYGRPLKYDASGKEVAGSFSLVWEDSLWGNDHDNDVVSMLTYCVGAACHDETNPNNDASVRDICWRSDSPVCASGIPNVGSNEVLVRIENLSAYAGNAMLTGFAIFGSDDDGIKRVALRPGGTDGSLLTVTGDPNCPATGTRDNVCSWTRPQVFKFSLGSSDAKLLRSPLWYAAKYGSFVETESGDDVPNLAPEWDANGDGDPDGYFLARDPSKLKQRLDEILGRAAGNGGLTAGGNAGSRLNAGSYTIEASFNLPEDSNDWTGNVVAHNVDDAGQRGTERWNAASKLPAAAAREIYTVITPTRIRNNGTVQNPDDTKEFTAENLCIGGFPACATWPREMLGLSDPPAPSWLGGASQSDIGARDHELVDYLRGEQSQEQKNGGRFRNRSSRIGDIVNSSVEIVTEKDEYDYARWDGGAGWRDALGQSYKAFLEAKRASPTPTVYVNANDGMLHAFDASPTGGRERFAYIPSTSRERMGELANPEYSHRYSMDGAITAADVPTTASGGWRTLLLTSAGTGGRSVSALNVTDPDAFDENDVLWELRGSDEGYSGLDELGHVLGKPMIVPVDGGATGPRWVALFGNGVNSQQGHPVLFVVDVNDGSVLARLDPVEDEDDDIAQRNGLINIAPISLNNTDGLVDTVYGGDMKGNIWKFDLSSDDPDDWEVAYTGEPLFTATDRDGNVQPITGGLEVSRGPGSAVTIYFGTGRYFAVGDNNVTSSSQVQSLYGIHDTGGTITGAREDALVEQTISSGGASGGYTLRNVSQNDAGRRGWFVDLISGERKGEMFFGTPRLQNGKVFFTTYEPSGDDCDPGGTSWLYGLELRSGAGAMSGVSVSPGGESVCTGDCGGLSLGKGAPVRDTNVLLPPPPSEELTCPPTDPTCSNLATLTAALELRQCTLVLRASGANPLYMPRPCGRQSWRQIR